MDEVGASSPRSAGRRYGLRDALLALYVLTCLLANGWPLYAWFGNSIRPFVLGVPFTLAWVVGWVLLTFVVVGIYYLTGDAEGDDA